MNSLLTGYRVMATVVGVLLIVLCLVGLPLHWAHLVNPAWTLTEAARLAVAHGAVAWPVQYLAGRHQLVRLLERERAASGAEAADRENRALGV